MSTTSPYLDSTLPDLLALARATATGPARQAPAGPTLIRDARWDLVWITGRDRARFLHAMLSNDVANLKPGEGRWATLNNHQGRTVTDVHLLHVDPDPKVGAHLAILEPGAAARFVECLERFVISEKVRFEVVPWGARVVAGPGARAALEQSALPLPSDARWAHAGRGDGSSLRVVRWDEGDTYVILGDEAAMEGVDVALADLPSGDGLDLEHARIRRGTPRFGIDWTEQHIPLEAGLKDHAISFTKGCYIGQEVICRLDAMGTPPRRLAKVRVMGGCPAPGTALSRDGKEVGYLTSLAPETDGSMTALAFVRRGHLDPGTAFEAEGGRAELLMLVE